MDMRDREGDEITTLGGDRWICVTSVGGSSHTGGIYGVEWACHGVNGCIRVGAMKEVRGVSKVMYITGVDYIERGMGHVEYVRHMRENGWAPFDAGLPELGPNCDHVESVVRARRYERMCGGEREVYFLGVADSVAEVLEVLTSDQLEEYARLKDRVSILENEAVELRNRSKAAVIRAEYYKEQYDELSDASDGLMDRLAALLCAGFWTRLKWVLTGVEG